MDGRKEWKFIHNFYTEIKLPETSQKKDLWVMDIVKEGTLIAQGVQCLWLNFLE